jgi:hypothetical protein
MQELDWTQYMISDGEGCSTALVGHITVGRASTCSFWRQPRIVAGRQEAFGGCLQRGDPGPQTMSQISL